MSTFLRMPEPRKLIFCIRIRSPWSVRPVKCFVVFMLRKWPKMGSTSFKSRFSAKFLAAKGLRNQRVPPLQIPGWLVLGIRMLFTKTKMYQQEKDVLIQSHRSRQKKWHKESREPSQLQSEAGLPGSIEHCQVHHQYLTLISASVSRVGGLGLHSNEQNWSKAWRWRSFPWNDQI